MTVVNNLNGRTSVSIPRDLILEIDRERGDVSRSRYLLRILEKSHTGTRERSRIDEIKSIKD
jgi:hypothetical protein